MRTYQFLLSITLTALSLTHQPVQAEWVTIDARYQSHPLQTVYIDPDTIRREGNLVTLSTLVDWKWMQGNRSPSRFYSTKTTKQIDCIAKQVRTMAATDFYGHLGTGQVVGGGHSHEDYWVPIEPGSLNQGLWEAACGKE
jgi:hypothetical protein